MNKFLLFLFFTTVVAAQSSTFASLGSESTIIAAAIVTVIAATVSGMVGVINALSAASDRKSARMERVALISTTVDTNHKTDALIEKTAEIHTLTNSNLSKVTTALDIANEKIQGLEKLMATMIANTLEVDRARLEQPPDNGSRDRRAEDPVRVEVVNIPLITKTEPRL